MKKYRFYTWLTALGVSLMLFMQGCYPGGPDIVGELDLVATSFDQSYDFSRVKTYLMPDSVVHIRDQYGQDQVNPAYDPYILQTIENQLQARGFTRLDDANATQKADVVVLASVTGNTNVSITSNPYDYWGWYPGWGGYSGFGPGWGYGYPGYYSPVIATAYQTGTLAIQMVDPNQVAAGSNTLPTVWVATFNGLLEGSPASIRDRIVEGIGQAFSQSPYLGEGGGTQ